MQISIFLILVIVWLMVLLYHLENPKKMWVTAAFYFLLFLLGGSFYASGVQYQTGWDIVSNGGNTTATIVTTDLIAAESGWANVGWLGIGIGFFGILVNVLIPFVYLSFSKIKSFIGD